MTTRPGRRGTSRQLPNTENGCNRLGVHGDIVDLAECDAAELDRLALPECRKRSQRQRRERRTRAMAFRDPQFAPARHVSRIFGQRTDMNRRNLGDPAQQVD